MRFYDEMHEKDAAAGVRPHYRRFDDWLKRQSDATMARTDASSLSSVSSPSSAMLISILSNPAFFAIRKHSASDSAGGSVQRLIPIFT